MKKLDTIYTNWRADREKTDVPFFWACSYDKARKDFSNYAELKEEISYEDMLKLERNYAFHKMLKSRQTGRITRISISEKTYKDYDVHPTLRREEKIIVHDGWEWHMGCVQNEEELKKMLDFLEIELTTVDHEVEYDTTGKIVFYNLSKNINRPCMGGFWDLEQLEEVFKDKKVKKFKGLSNGSLVDCYAVIGEDIVDIYEPNPNAKNVYVEMEIKDEIKFRKTHWYL